MGKAHNLIVRTVPVKADRCLCPCSFGHHKTSLFQPKLPHKFRILKYLLLEPVVRQCCLYVLPMAHDLDSHYISGIPHTQILTFTQDQILSLIQLKYHILILDRLINRPFYLSCQFPVAVDPHCHIGPDPGLHLTGCICIQAHSS